MERIILGLWHAGGVSEMLCSSSCFRVAYAWYDGTYQHGKLKHPPFVKHTYRRIDLLFGEVRVWVARGGAHEQRNALPMARQTDD